MYQYRKYVFVIPCMLCILLCVIYSFLNISDATAVLHQELEEVIFWDQVHKQAIKPYYNAEDDCFYLFLPTCSNAEDIRVRSFWGTKVFLSEDVRMTSLKDIPVGQNVEIEVTDFASTEFFTIHILKSDGVKTLFLDIKEGGLENIHESKENWENVAVHLIDQHGTTVLNKMAILSGRGNGTWRRQAKRPYNLKFSQPVSIGSLEDITKLCLMAEYSDESRMRNALAFYAAREMGIPFASPYEYADLYINGEYKGIYGLCTKQEFEKNHQIALKAVFELSSSAITLGEEGWFFETDLWERKIRVYKGDVRLVHNIANQLETALEKKDWAACDQLISLSSFAEKYVLDEFMANYDMTFASQYYYIGEDNRIYCMLPWDYDWSLGAAISYFDSAQETSLLTYRPFEYYCTVLLQNERFIQEVKDVVQEQYTDDFLEDLTAFTEETNQLIDSSRNCDRIRWKDEKPYIQDSCQSGFDQMSELVDFFCRYYPKRRDFMLHYFSDPENYYIVHLNLTSRIYFNFISPKDQPLIPASADYPKLNASFWNNGITGWYTASGQPLEELGPINQDIQLYAQLRSEPIAEDNEQPEEIYIPDDKPVTTIDRLLHFRTELIILVLFASSASMLFGIEIKHVFSGKRGIRKNCEKTKNNT